MTLDEETFFTLLEARVLGMEYIEEFFRLYVKPQVNLANFPIENHHWRDSASRRLEAVGSDTSVYLHEFRPVHEGSL